MLIFNAESLVDLFDAGILILQSDDPRVRLPDRKKIMSTLQKGSLFFRLN